MTKRGEIKFTMRALAKYSQKENRKEMFRWVYRYLRLHQELLEDSLYQEMYNFHRNTLIAHFEARTNLEQFDKNEYSQLLDACADMFNKRAKRKVDRYKGFVELLYAFWAGKQQGKMSALGI